MIRKAICILSVIIWISCSTSKKEEIVETDAGKKRVIYYQDGSIKSEVPLSIGEPNGTEIVYYESGKLREENDWVYGKKIGHQFKYYDSQDTVITLADDGSPMLTAISLLKSYDYFNLKGGISYTIEYNEEGDVINQEGHEVIAYTLDKENISLNDTVAVRLKYPLIDAEIVATLYEVKENGQFGLIDSLEISYDYMESDFLLVVDSKITLSIVSNVKINSYSKTDTSYLETIIPM